MGEAKRRRASDPNYGRVPKLGEASPRRAFGDGAPVLYRYGPAQDIERLCSGSVRVGTLHDFRGTEHRIGVGDPEEGKLRQHLHIANETFRAGHNDPRLAALGGFDIQGDGRVTMIDCTGTINNEAPNCYLFCFAEVHARTAMQSIGGASACAELVNVFDFLRAVTARLSTRVPVRYQGANRVTYRERSEQWSEHPRDHPALIKEPRFAAQAEVRAIWTREDGQPLQPVIMSDPADLAALAGFWRRIEPPRGATLTSR